MNGCSSVIYYQLSYAKAMLIIERPSIPHCEQLNRPVSNRIERIS